MYVGDSAEYTGRPLPSIVGLNSDNTEIKIGNTVKKNIKSFTNNGSTISSIKTILDDTDKSWNFNGKKVNAVDIASYLFKELKKNAKEQDINVTDAVVAVPINFSATKKKCIKEAASKAGINIKNFISEPTAAYLAHYVELKSYNNIVVFDWGGGTLDISALEIENSTIKEIYTDNLYKAGDDIDRNLAKFVYKNIIKNYGLKNIPLNELPGAEYDELLSKVELCKISLSDPRCDIAREICTIQGKTVNIIITNNDLCDVCNTIIEDAIELLRNVLLKSFGREVDCILCVGGSSNLKPLRERLKNCLGNSKDRLYFPDDPQWDIADGACTIDASKCKNVYMLPYDISVKLSNGDYLSLLKEGQVLPCQISSINVSTTDCSEQANFIFKIGKNNEAYVTIPVLGGIDEVLTLEAFIDEYLVLHIDMMNHKTKERYNIFNYEKLELIYNI